VLAIEYKQFKLNVENVMGKKYTDKEFAELVERPLIEILKEKAEEVLQHETD
jgi:hypothetical protein